MSKKSIKRNYIYNVMYQILAILIPVITTPYLSRVLGAENIGIYSFTLSITTYFILFGSLGVAMYGQREIAYAQDDIEQRSKTFFEIFIMKCITLFLCLIIFYVTFCINGEYQFYYKILILEIVANIIDISWLFQGLEEFKKTVVRNTIVKIVSVICIFLLVKTQDDLYKYFIIYVLSTFLGNISLWLYLPKFIKKQKIKELNIVRHIKPTVLLFIPQMATQIYTVLDKTMIGVIVSDKSEVGYYEQAQKIIKMLMTIATSLGTVMMPRIAATYAKGDNKKIKEYMKQSFSFIMMITLPMMFGIINIAHDFVPIFYGEGYDKVIPLLCIISPIIVLIGLSNVTGTQYLLPTKQQNKYTISVIVGAIVNFILNFALINNFQSIGASIATVIAEFSITVIQFILIRKTFKISEVLKIVFKYIIASIIMFIIGLIINMIINNINGIASIVIQCFVSATVYFSVLIILKDKFIINIISKIKLIFKKGFENKKEGVK